MERATDFTAPPGANSNQLSPPPMELARRAKLSPIGFWQGVASSGIVLASRDSSPRHSRAAFVQFDLEALDGVFSRVYLNPVAMDHTPITDMKFETALAELEAVVHSMEDGKLELEASIAAYRRGMELMLSLIHI